MVSIRVGGLSSSASALGTSEPEVGGGGGGRESTSYNRLYGKENTDIINKTAKTKAT